MSSRVTDLSWTRTASVVSEVVNDDQDLVAVACVLIHNGTSSVQKVCAVVRTQLMKNLLSHRDVLRVKGQH